MIKTIKKYGFMYWWGDTKVYDVYRYITVRFPERLMRSIAFARHGWLNYDFDAHYVHELALFKLKRMKHCFIKYGHHSEECSNYKPKMKSLTLCIKLLEKYCKDEHQTIHMDAHERKWGKLITWTTEDRESKTYGTLYEWHSRRPNANTEEEKEQEHKEFRAAYDADYNRNERILATAYRIMAKYHRYWWD
jgi:hypothetical protein